MLKLIKQVYQFFRNDQQRAWNFLYAEKGITPMLLNMYTGAGKTTLMLLKALLSFYRTGLPTLIAIPSHHLINQLVDGSLADLKRAGVTRNDIGIWRPLSAYASPERAKALSAQLGVEITVEDGELTASVLERYHDEVLAELFGHGDICLTKQCTLANNEAAWAAYHANLLPLENKKIIVLTHHSLVIETKSGSYLPFEYGQVIVDEADQIYNVCSNLRNSTISACILKKLRGGSKKDLDAPTLESTSYLLSVVDQLIAGKRKNHPYSRQELHQLRGTLRVMHNHFSEATPEFIRSVGLEASSGDWKIEYAKPAGIMRFLTDKHPTLYLSATLTIDGDNIDDFASIVGLHKRPHEQRIIDPEEHFGTTRFCLYQPDNEEKEQYLHNKIKDAEEGLRQRYAADPELVRSVLQKIELTKESDHVLILVPSTNDSLAIAELLPEAECQQRHESLHKTLARFHSNNKRILICHGGWAGLNPTIKRFNHLIIGRLPYAKPSEIRNEFFANYQAWTIRKLMQAFGRVIRKEDDEATIYILDFRMNVPNRLIQEFLCDNSYIAHHQALIYAIHKRFRKSIFEQAGSKEKTGYHFAKLIRKTKNGVEFV